MIFFISDSHFSHGNIIKYCNRPFSSKEEMDLTMIRNWNSRVKDEDTVFHLGDFSLIKSSEAPDAVKDNFSFIRNQLKGNIIFIQGNHDSRNKNKSVIESMVINYGGSRIYMTHNPKFAKPDFKWNFAGHVHEKWQFQKLGENSTIVNLSVEQWKYAPVTIGEIQAAYSRWIKSKINNA